MHILVGSNSSLTVNELKEHLTPLFDSGYLVCLEVLTLSELQAKMDSHTYKSYFLDIKTADTDEGGEDGQPALDGKSLKKLLMMIIKEIIDSFLKTSNRVSIETREGVFIVPFSKIIAVEACEKKVIVYTTERKFESVHKMKDWKKWLSDNRFFQSHRSFIINLSHVKEYNRTTVFLPLPGNQIMEAYLTRRKYRAFVDAYSRSTEETPPQRSAK